MRSWLLDNCSVKIVFIGLRDFVGFTISVSILISKFVAGFILYHVMKFLIKKLFTFDYEI